MVADYENGFRLIDYAIGRWFRWYYDEPALRSAGHMAMIDSPKHFKEGAGAKYTTYLLRAIRKNMLNVVKALGSQNRAGHWVDYKGRIKISYINIDNAVGLRDEKATSIQGVKEGTEYVLNLINKSKFSEKQKKMLRLYYVDGCSMKDISEIIGCSKQLVGAVVSDKVKLLKPTVMRELMYRR